MIDQVRRALAGLYRIDRELGQGGMAAVFLAEDLKHHRPVAVKVLRHDLAASLGSERFLREIEIAARLNHPHILPVHDSGASDGVLYYVMPVVEGESLRQLMNREKQLPVEQTLEIARQVASALDYAHRQGVVHRDIKPENVMLHQGEAMVMDFGIALAVSAVEGERLTGTGLAIGTPAYMSPEQATGSAAIDARSDIYSLGCVVYEMLAGEPPYTGPTPQAIMARSLTDEAPKIHTIRRAVPESVDAAVAQALSTTPADRPGTAGEFVAMLSSSATGVRRRGRRNVPQSLMAAGIAGLLVAAGLFWAWPRAAASSVTPGTEVLAVVPFNAVGADVEVLGEGMIDLLSTNLDGVGGIRTVDPGTVLSRWHRRSDGGGGLETALAVGREVEAGSILTGSAVQAGNSVRITADLYLVDGQKLATASIDGPTDSVLTLVDSLSLRLVREIWRAQEPLPGLRVSAITTGSADAIRAYLRGEQYYRRAEWDSAIVSFQEAVDADSTFALAYARLGFSHGWVTSLFGRPFAEAVAAAARLADRLPERDRSLVVAGQLFGEFSLAGLDTMRAYVARYPGDADGWFLLGDIQYHAQPILALSPDDYYGPFERAVELNPSLAAALIHPIELSLSTGDSVRFARYRELYEQVGGDLPADLGSLNAIAWSRSDTTLKAVRRAFREIRLLYGRFPALFYGSPALTPQDLLVGLEMPARLPAGLPPGANLMQRGSVLQSLGRLAEARVVAESLKAYDQIAGYQMLLAPLFGGYASPSLADEAVDLLARISPDSAPHRAIVSLGLKDLEGARQAIRLGLDPDFELTQGPPKWRNLFTAAAGSLKLLEGDTASGVQELRAAFDEIGFGNLAYAVTPLRFQLAATLAARPQTRAEGIRRLRWGFPYAPQYRAVGHMLIARALEAEGDRTGAADAYAEVLRLWKGADPELQPMVRDVRDALTRLTAEPVN